MVTKICLLTDSLASGGAEKMVANLSQSFSQLGYSVTVVSMQNRIVYNYSGNLYNFGKVKESKGRLSAFLAFKQFFTKNQFDIILDHRVRKSFLKELLFSKFVFDKSKVIYCVHHYDLSLYFPVVNFPFLSKQTLVKNRRIVVVSKLAKQHISEKLKLDSEVIYNYPSISNLNTIGCNYDYIVVVGRLEKVKQIDGLIKAYRMSNLPKAKVKLLIFGEGSQRLYLSQLIEKLNLKYQLLIKGFDPQVAHYVKESKALVLPSLNEGFPMVLIEAIELKTPVISFNCKSGPSEIIDHNINGLLVKDQDWQAMTAALNKIIDKNFYRDLKSNLDNYDSPFTEKAVIKKWVSLMEQF